MPLIIIGTKGERECPFIGNATTGGSGKINGEGVVTKLLTQHLIVSEEAAEQIGEKKILGVTEVIPDGEGTVNKSPTHSAKFDPSIPVDIHVL